MSMVTRRCRSLCGFVPCVCLSRRFGLSLAFVRRVSSVGCCSIALRRSDMYHMGVLAVVMRPVPSPVGGMKRDWRSRVVV